MADHEPLLPRILAWGRDAPGRPAIRWGERSIAWRDLARRIREVAGALGRVGIARGDRVAVLASMRPEVLEVVLGTVAASGVAVPLPTTLGPGALEAIVEDARPALLFAGDADATTAPSCATRVLFDAPRTGWEAYDDWLEAAPPAEARPVDPAAAFNVIYSSGTTGEPKGVVQSHAMRVFQVERMGRLGFDVETRLLVATPLCSNATWVALLPTLAAGGTAVLLDGRFRGDRFLEVCERERITHAMLVPVQIRRVIEHPSFDPERLASFRLLLSTGAPFAQGVQGDVVERWPGRHVEIYGLTEGGCTTILDTRAHPEKLDSVGRPAEGVDVRIIGDDGREVRAGRVGEVVGRAVSQMTGYLGRDDLTESATWRDEDGRRFIRTGDLGRFDEDGFLHLAGRRKDVIVSGGQNVHPTDLERVLASHKAVADVAVVGVPSDRWGETPWAFVVLRTGCENDPEAIREWANARLGKAQRVSGISRLDALPRSALGKVRREDLRPG